MKEKFPYTAEELCKMLDDSHDFMKYETQGFLERNERIFYRKPSVNSNGQMEYSDLTDNTLASYLEKMPKSTIQKLPSFVVDANNRDKIEDLTYEYIAKYPILHSGSSEGYSLLQKQWIEMRNAATFGACAVYLPFMRERGEYTVGEVPIYWGDLYPEAYATNINSANYVIIRTLKTERDLKKTMDGLDKEQGEGTWSKKGLQTVLDYGKGNYKGDTAQNIKAQMDGLPKGMYELFIYTDEDWVVYFHYASQTILRAMRNYSGYKRVVALYSDYDGSSIMGRSMVDMAYTIQQALSSLLRGFIYTADYNTDPAKFVKGINLDEDSFNLKKGNTMFLNDEDGEVKLLSVDTTTVQQFPQLYSLLLGTMYRSLPSSNETLPAGSGDPNQSRTQAGVNEQANKADIENNYYRKNYEQYFEKVLEHKINIYVSEIRAIAEKNNAIPEVILNDEYANLVRELDKEGRYINSENKVRLDLSDQKPISISVDFESTRDLAKEEDLRRLNNFLTGFFEAAKSDPAMGKAMRSVLPLLMEEMTKSSNLDNSAKISQVMQEAIAQANQEEEQQRQLEASTKEKELTMANIKAPTVNIAFKDLPPAGQIQAAAKYGIELTAEDVMSQQATMSAGGM